MSGEATVTLACVAREVAREDLLLPVSLTGLNEEGLVWATILRGAKEDPSQKAKAIVQLQARGIPLAPAVLAVHEVIKTPAAEVATPPVPSQTPTLVCPPQVSAPQQPPQPIAPGKKGSWIASLITVLLLPLVLPLRLLWFCTKTAARTLLQASRWLLVSTAKIVWQAAGLGFRLLFHLLKACTMVIVPPLWQALGRFLEASAKVGIRALEILIELVLAVLLGLPLGSVVVAIALLAILILLAFSPIILFVYPMYKMRRG